MPEVPVEIGKTVFNARYWPLLYDQTRLQILFGGSSSGKSVFEASRVIIDLMKGGRNYLCVRNVSKTLRRSVFVELKKAIARFKAEPLFNVKESEMTITCVNGYQAMLSGLDDVEKLKSITPEVGALTDIWVEEATECNRDALKQLFKRLRGIVADGIVKRLVMTFNPINRSHWIFKDFFSRWTDDANEYRDEKLFIMHSTYKDNKFLAPDDIEALEDESDPYFYDVYTLGKWGVLGGVIFTNFTIVDIVNDPVFQTFDQFRHGLDFGYSVDPTAYIKSYYHRASKSLYLTDSYYDKGVTNDVIAENVKAKLNGDHVTCDSAEPKSIDELCKCGVNAIGARKGPDSIRHGVQWLQQQKIFIDVRLQNIINEFQQYHWKKDKHGEPLPVPVDKYNDGIDALRYACEDEMNMLADVEIKAHGHSAAPSDW